MKPFVAIVVGILATMFLTYQKVSTSDWSGGAGMTPREIMADYMELTYDQGQGSAAVAKYHAPEFTEHAAVVPEMADGAPIPNEVTLVVSNGRDVVVHHDVGPARGAPAGSFVDTYRIFRGRITDHWRAVRR